MSSGKEEWVKENEPSISSPLSVLEESHSMWKKVVQGFKFETILKGTCNTEELLTGQNIECILGVLFLKTILRSYQELGFSRQNVFVVLHEMSPFFLPTTY